MNSKLFILIIVITTMLIIGGAVMFTSADSSAGQIQISENSKVGIAESTYEWGTIKLNGGTVEKIFEIKNEGTSPLQLNKVLTSCTCTTAQLITTTGQSPLFRMHGQSNYIAEVNPGESAQLRVVFDPAFHGPSGVGPISRQISVSTNDPSHPELVFKLSAVVEN